MRAVGATDSGDGIGVGARRQPIEQLGAYGASAAGAISRIHGALASRNHQHHTRAHGPRLITPRSDAGVRAVERVAVQIECEIRFNSARFKAPFPMRIETCL